MITLASGNLLHADVEALVNTVNTEGVMGKGIALQFKKAYPEMFDAYRSAAKAGEIRLGHMHVWATGQLSDPRYVINFPTKGHWKSRSRLADVQAGLEDLVVVIRELGIRSIALPPLGCGNGGLDWADVEPLIVAAFDQVPDVRVELFPPAGAPAAAEMSVSARRPQMTLGRAALIDLVGRYTRQALVSPGLIEAQKLMYFLQEAGEPLRLNYAANRYGPYADNLRHVLNTVEGHFLIGYGDASATVADAEPLRVVEGAADEASSVLRDAGATRERIGRVMDLASGFESAYGLELLATVHWLATGNPAADDEELTGLVREWSPRKARMFTVQHVGTALGALRGRGWLPDTAVA